METTNEDLLQQCQRHFPGLAWEILPGVATGTAGQFFVELRLEREGVTAICEANCRRWGHSYQTILTSDRFPDEPLTNEQALAQAAERWREFVAEAGAVVGPLPEKPAYKPSPEIQQQSDMALAAWLLEGDRRKAQGLPPDQAAQAQAAADAMAWAEDNPMSP